MAANGIVSHTQTQDDDRRASCTTKGKGQPFMTWKKKLTALVLDHGKTCRMLEQGYMSAYGVETEAVDSGLAAIQLISSGSTFNVIFIDMHLTGMKAPEIIKQLRVMGVRSRIVGMSVAFTEREREAFLEAGGDDYLEKPMRPDTFVPILKDLDSQQCSDHPTDELHANQTVI